MSYADVASKGPKQSPEDARAPHLGGNYEEEGSTASLVDVDSPHVQTVDPSFLNQDIKTTTQAERVEREEEDEEKRKIQQHKKARAAAYEGSISRNKSNPVYVGNALVLGLVGAGLGVGAYRKHLEGALSWQVVGVASGVVGAFGVVDYFVSKWFLQNKYPPK